MALSLRKKKPVTALAPFNPEEIMQGEPPSLQTVKLDMTLQVLSLFVQPIWKKYQPFLSIVKMAGIAIPDSLDQLISVILQTQNDALMKSSVLSVCEIMRAAVDDQVTPQAFEEILLRGIDVIKVVNATKVEEVPA